MIIVSFYHKIFLKSTACSTSSRNFHIFQSCPSLHQKEILRSKKTEKTAPAPADAILVILLLLSTV